MDLRHLSYVTASSLHNAIGLRQPSDARKHWKEFVAGKTNAPPNPKVQRRMDHGTLHEIDAFGTFAARLLPICCDHPAIVREIGPKFIDGKLHSQLLCDSADGVINLPGGKTAVLELKCPFPGDRPLENMPVHYKLPTYYVAQVLLHMKAHSADHAFYSTWSQESSTLIRCDWHQPTFDLLFDKVCELFEVPVIVQPSTQRAPWKTEILAALLQYVDNNSEFLFEIPSVTAHEGEIDADPQTSAYNIPPPKDLPSNISTDLALPICCQEATTTVKEIHDVLRRKASEMIVFIAADTDRISVPDEPLHNIIGWGLKGNSMAVDVMRKMMHDVQNKCHQQELLPKVKEFGGRNATCKLANTGC